MAKSSREHVYGLNPAFEVLRAGKRRVYSAHLNEGMRDNTRVKKLLGVERFLKLRETLDTQ